MPLIDTLSGLLARASRALGLETVDRFPAGHPHSRTRWDRAYFDIASDLKPDAIERAICEAITNTPAVFGHIVHPTPRMQRSLLAAIDNMRHSCGKPGNLLQLLIEAYASPYTMEALPGLRAAIQRTEGCDVGERVHELLGYLRASPAAFGTVDEGIGNVQPRYSLEE